MFVSTIAILLNITIALITVILFFWKRKSPEWIAVIYFSFMSLYFSHTAFFILFRQNIGDWVNLYGNSIYSKISGISVLCALILIGFQYYRQNRDSIQKLYFLIIPVTLIIAGYLLNADLTSHSQFQDILSSITMIGMGWILCYVLLDIQKKKFLAIAQILFPYLLGYLFLAVMLGFYEILSQKAWAGYLSSDGFRVYRASSFFFNPNWFAAWLVIVGIFIIYLNDKQCISRRLLGPAMFLVGTGLYLSGSRGMFLCAIIVYGLLFVLRKNKSKLFVLETIFFGALGFLLVFGVTSLFLNLDSSIGKPLVVLEIRWKELPSGLWNLTIHILSENVFPFHAKSQAEIAKLNDISISVRGRFSGNYADNGFLAVFGTGGIISLSGIILFWIGWGTSIFFSFLKIKPTINIRELIYAIILFIFFSIWTFQARTPQVFPMWAFGSLFFACTVIIIHNESPSK